MRRFHLIAGLLLVFSLGVPLWGAPDWSRVKAGLSVEEAEDALLQRFDRQLARDGAQASETLPLVSTALESIPPELAEIENQQLVAQ